MTTWKDTVYSRIPKQNLQSRIFWHAARIGDQTRTPELTHRQAGDAAYKRALRIVTDEDAGLGMPLDEMWDGYDS